jgi:hypothetical protein
LLVVAAALVMVVAALGGIGVQLLENLQVVAHLPNHPFL